MLLIILLTILTFWIKTGIKTDLAIVPPRGESVSETYFSRGLSRIKKNLLNEFSVDSDISSVLNITNKIGDRIPETSARQVLIATSWRSGSSFLGELINQQPGTFYYFEPLHYYSYIRNKSTVQTEVDFVSSLFKCRFTGENEGYLEHVSKPEHSFLFTRHNSRLWSSCTDFKPRESLCFSADYMGEVCSRHPVRLVKTVRLRVREASHLLDSLEELKLVVLVRDPRAVFNSRWSGRVSTWCHNQH